MNNSSFSLYFFYTKRQKLRNSIFLTFFLPALQTFLLLRYKEANYKKVDYVITLLKVLISSIFYVLLFYAGKADIESAMGLCISISIFISFFTLLILLNLSKESIQSIEKDHYFRMIGESRNNLIKDIIRKRINYAVLNWLIPFTLGPILYVILQGEVFYLAGYLLFIGLFYTLTVLTIFVSQRLYFETFRNVVFMKEYLAYIGGFLVMIFSISSFIALRSLDQYYEFNWIAHLFVFVLIIILIVALFKLCDKVVSKTINYSLTNTVIQSKRKPITDNSIAKESRYVKLITKNETIKTLFKKDYIRLVRKKKKPLFTIIILGLNSLAYSIFVISGILEDRDIDGIDSIYFVDNLFLVVILLFIVNSFYKYKNDTWYSAEGTNTALYSRFKIDKYTILKEKKLLNYTLYIAAILLYAIPPIFTIPFVEGIKVYYILYRIIYIYLITTVLIDYAIIKDLYKPRKFPHETIAGMGLMNTITLIVAILGVGVSSIILHFEDSLYLNDIIYTLLITQFTIALLLKLYYLYKGQKLKGIYEGEKIYGDY